MDNEKREWFQVVEARFKLSTTGHGPDAVDAEMKLEGPFGEIYLWYNDFGGKRFCASKWSVFEQLESPDPQEVPLVEEWEGGLEATEKSEFRPGFAALADFVRGMESPVPRPEGV